MERVKKFTMTWQIIDEDAVIAAYNKLRSDPYIDILACKTVEEMARELVLNYDKYGLSFGVTSFYDLGLEY